MKYKLRKLADVGAGKRITMTFVMHMSFYTSAFPPNPKKSFWTAFK